jgi:hypothetical protein
VDDLIPNSWSLLVLSLALVAVNHLIPWPDSLIGRDVILAT